MESARNVYLHGKVFKWVFLAIVVLRVLFLNCDNPVPPLQDFTLTDDLISRYPCDKATKDDHYLLQSNTGPHVFKVSPISFCVIGIATASNSVGFCHVKNVNSAFLCSSKDCTRYASKTKASKTKKICLHIHVLLCILLSP